MSNADERLVEAYTDKDQGLIARFLGVKKYKMKNMHMVFPFYKKALFYKAVHEITNKHDVRASFDISYGQVVTSSFEYLEVGRGNKEELMTCGYRLIIKEGVRFSINVDQTWSGHPYIVLSYGESNALEATLILDEVLKYMKDNNFYIGEKIDVTGKFLTVEDIDFDDVILPESQKKTIKVSALDFFEKKEVYEKHGLIHKRGLILTGVPGVGKTLTCKLLMNKCDSTFLWVSSDKLTRADDIKFIYSIAAELAPIIIVLEDLDDYLELTSAKDTLKTTLDGMNSVSGIVTIMCTNHPDRLPMSLLRPGRFDDLLIFKLPDESLRLKLLEKITESMRIENVKETIKDISKNTEGFTPAQLKEIMIYSLLLAVDDNRDVISVDDIANAIVKIQDTQHIISEELRDMDVKAFLNEVTKTGEIKKNGECN